MKNIGRAFDIFLLLLGIFFTAYYFTLLFARYNLSIQYVWIIIGAAFIIKSVWSLRQKTKPRRWVRILNIVIGASFAVFLSTLSLFCTGIIISMNVTPAENLDYIIILGAAVRGHEPSETLRARIDAGYEYLTQNAGTKAIASGGQGINESISEGECIAQELVHMGIGEDRILVEDKSTTTAENLRYSIEFLDRDDSSVGVVTSNFHLFRSRLMLSHRLNHGVEGIPADYGGITVPHYMLREYIAFLVDFLFRNI